jgi:hypothetical protein
MKNQYKIFFFIFLLLAINTLVLHAQSAPVGFSDPQSADAPLDGGLSILLAGAVGYGLKRVRDQKKNQAEDIK